MRTTIAVLLLFLGGFLIFQDSIALPQSGLTSANVVAVNIVKTSNDDTVTVPRVIVSIHSEFVRYAVFLPADSYLLSVTGTPAEVDVKPVTDANTVEPIDLGDEKSLFALKVTASGPALDSNDGYWDFYWDLPVHPPAIGIGRFRLPISVDSSHITITGLGPYDSANQIELTDLRLTVLLDVEGLVFENVDSASSERRLNLPVNLDNYVGASDRVVTFRSRLGTLVASLGLVFLGLGAGYFLGSLTAKNEGKAE